MRGWTFVRWKNVTLMGTPSDGGSGRSETLRLHHSLIELHTSTMASFRADGSLYDGRGVALDVEMKPTATDFIGKTDTILDAAIQRLLK